MKKFLTFAGLTLSLAASFSVASAQERQQQPPQDGQRQEGGPFGRRGHRGHGRRGEGGGGHVMRALGRLDLTDAQRTQIRSIHEATRQRTETQRAELRQLFEMRRGGGQLTPEQETRADQLASELRATRESANQQILSLLTAEQRTQLEQWKQERGTRKHRRPADDN